MTGLTTKGNKDVNRGDRRRRHRLMTTDGFPSSDTHYSFKHSDLLAIHLSPSQSGILACHLETAGKLESNDVLW